jgi:hypothetical protein
VSLRVLAAAFLVVGGVARYGIVIPHFLGLGGDILPSVVSMLAKVYSAGLMLLLMLSLRSGGRLLPLAVVLIAIELLAGVMLFRKADVLITVLFVMLAFYQHRPTPLRLVLGGLLVATVFYGVAPFMGFGRIMAIEIAGGREMATVEQRWGILQAYIDGERLPSDNGEVQHALARLSYVNAATMVVGWYDQGRPDESMTHLMAALIPRFMWPDKPDLTESGRALYTLATGNEGTSISAGLFAEAYANLGWWGVPLLMFPLGIILTVLSRMAITVMGRGQYLYLPVVLIGVHVGTRVDGHFVTDVIGAPFTIVVMYGILRIVEGVLSTPTRSRARF